MVALISLVVVKIVQSRMNKKKETETSVDPEKLSGDRVVNASEDAPQEGLLFEKNNA